MERSEEIISGDIPYEIVGEVVHGEKRGRKLGFPTINISVDKNIVTPNKGVYKVKVKVSNEWHDAIMNVGNKPTYHSLENSDIFIEAHILDFSDNIYGEIVTIRVESFIREEKKFQTEEELIMQINSDIAPYLRR